MAGEIVVKMSCLREAKEHLQKEIDLAYKEAGHEVFEHFARWDILDLQERNGRHLSLVAFKDGKPVGMSGCLLYDHIHYGKELCASVHLVYVYPDHRKQGVVEAILKTYEETLKPWGIKRIEWGVPSEKIEASLPEDWERLEVVYAKEL